MYKKNHSPHEKPVVLVDAQGKKAPNPNEITLNQHVIPQAHLKEWSRVDGRLNVFNKRKASWFTPRPKDAFTVQRLWDQWTEKVFLKSNENNYQRQVALIKASQPIENHEHVSAYFFMLCIRAEVAAKNRPDSGLTIKLCSEPLSQGELEDIELQNVDSSVHLSYPGGDGSQALAREAVKHAMNLMFLRGMSDFKGMVWTPFTMTDQDAILPDSLIEINNSETKILPVTPKVVLVGSRSNDDASTKAAFDASTINELLFQSSASEYIALSQTRVENKA